MSDKDAGTRNVNKRGDIGMQTREEGGEGGCVQVDGQWKGRGRRLRGENKGIWGRNH